MSSPNIAQSYDSSYRQLVTALMWDLSLTIKYCVHQYGDPWGFHAIKNVRVPLVLLQINFKYTTYLMLINLYIFRSYRIEINIFTFKTYFEAKNIMRIIDI